jgi:integrase
MMAANIAMQNGTKRTGKGRTFGKLSFHSLRHSFISRLANAEISPELRMTMVGHTTDDVHQRYTHLNLSLQAAAIGKLSSVLTKES